MNPPHSCPDEDRLVAMLDGSLPTGEQQTVQDHVGECETCQQRLELLVARTAEPLALRVLSEGSQVSEVTIDQLGRERATPQSESRSQMKPGIECVWLEPSSLPDSLGRLAHYEILELIGRGGMGMVYKARDTHLQRLVAIKVLAPELAANGTARRRFLREARAAAAVSHDHIITIYAVEEGPVPFFAMELIDGQTLQDKIERTGPLELVETLRIGQQIAAGLAAAHAHGLIHRDIKPANILLQNGIQRVKITDFGLARLVDDAGLTQSGEVTGTPQYMSPEQAQGLTVDGRSDLFSLGSVLYAMCTGRSPFRAESTVAVLRRVCDQAPRPISDLNREVPHWLTEIIGRLLEKSPTQRFQTADAVAEHLGRHLARLQQPVASPTPVSECEPTARGNGHARGRSRTWLIGSLMVVAILSALGVTEATNLTHLAGTVIRVITGEGVVVVELDDPTIKVTIDGEEVVITEAGAKEVRVRAGRHKVAATKEGKSVPVSQELVTITRGGRQVVRITYEPPATAAQATIATSSSALESSPGPAPPPAVAPFSAAQAKAHQQTWARHLGVPVEYTNSIGMQFLLIPPGGFVAGSPPQGIEEALRIAESFQIVEDRDLLLGFISSESPQHEVKLTQPIYLGAREVTQRQYERVMSHNPSYFSSAGDGANLVADDDTLDYPVEMVSWHSAATFCARLSAMEKLASPYRWEGDAVLIQPAGGYQLPTEAVWEFACRAGTQTAFWFGPTGKDLANIGWFEGNSQGQSHPVAGRWSNPFGLYDIAGNVSEWCEDGFDAKYYSQFEERTAIDPRGPSSGFVLRIFKGGNWFHGFLGCRSAARGAMGPKRTVNCVGLRVALPVESVKRLLAARKSKPAETSGAPDGKPRSSAPP